jgi:hypothetical protein
MKKLYYHVLEYGDYGMVGYQGMYKKLSEAEAEVKRLSDFFPDSTFEIFVDTSTKQPPIVTV